MQKDLKIKIKSRKQKAKKCEECIFFIKNAILDQEIQKATELQQKYLNLIKKVNETLAKYEQKIDELDKRDK